MRQLVVLICLFFLCACGREQIATELTLKQANEIVSVLSEHGLVSLVKAAGRGGSSFAVEVDESDYTYAVTLIHSYQLPKEETESFKDLTDKRGFLPNSKSLEAVRLDRAQALDLEEKLSVLPSIAEVKVILRSNSLKKGELPSASVLVVHHKEAQLDDSDILDVVELAVPGLSVERIKIVSKQKLNQKIVTTNKGVYNVDGKVVHYPLVPFLRWFAVPQRDYKELSTFVVLMLLLSLLVGYLAGLFIGRYRTKLLPLHSDRELSSLVDPSTALQMLNKPQKRDDESKEL